MGEEVNKWIVLLTVLMNGCSNCGQFGPMSRRQTRFLGSDTIVCVCVWGVGGGGGSDKAGRGACFCYNTSMMIHQSTCKLADSKKTVYFHLYPLTFFPSLFF